MKGVPLEVVLRSLPKICRTGVVTSYPGKLRHQMLGNASKIRIIKMSSRAEERAASSANCPTHLYVSQTTSLTPSTSILDEQNSTPALAMAKRKVWVKRLGSSPTQISFGSDDLVDDVRDVILRKYANSLGRSFDSPDVTLKIVTRDSENNNASNERTLGPEEHMGNTLDAAYPSGQTIDEALIIDVPKRRTPRPSPMVGHHMPYYITEELRPEEGAGEYFPPMPAVQSPRLNHITHVSSPHHPSAMAVLTTGQLPPLPSPGSRTHRHHGRPKYGRQHTSSPTILHTIPSNGNLAGASTKSVLYADDRG
jgi:osomolarity two-component system, response regulator SSK1